MVTPVAMLRFQRTPLPGTASASRSVGPLRVKLPALTVAVSPCSNTRSLAAVKLNVPSFMVSEADPTPSLKVWVRLAVELLRVEPALMVVVPVLPKVVLDWRSKVPAVRVTCELVSVPPPVSESVSPVLLRVIAPTVAPPAGIEKVPFPAVPPSNRSAPPSTRDPATVKLRPTCIGVATLLMSRLPVVAVTITSRSTSAFPVPRSSVPSVIRRSLLRSRRWPRIRAPPLVISRSVAVMAPPLVSPVPCSSTRPRSTVELIVTLLLVTSQSSFVPVAPVVISPPVMLITPPVPLTVTPLA